MNFWPARIFTCDQKALFLFLSQQITQAGSSPAPCASPEATKQGSVAGGSDKHSPSEANLKGSRVEGG